MKRFRFLFLASLLPAALQAASPYLPPPGTLQVTLNYAFDRCRNFSAGNATTALPGTLTQNSFLPNLSLGLTNRLALDFDTSITRAALPGITLTAPANTSYGLRFQAWRKARVTITLQGSGIRSEFYPIDLGPVPSGVIVNGFHGSVLTGIALPKQTFVLLDAGYVVYQKPANGRFAGSAFLGQNRGKWTYYAGYQDNRAVEGIDIAGINATRIRFAEQRRVIGAFAIGGGYTLPKSVYLGATYSRWVIARNAPQSNSLAISLGFQVRVFRR